jgi:hypothetical protein
VNAAIPDGATVQDGRMEVVLEAAGQLSPVYLIQP